MYSYSNRYFCIRMNNVVIKYSLFGFIILVIFACNTSKVHSTKLAKDRKKLAYKDSSLLAKRNAGIDFIASGNEPEPWQLEMDHDKSYVFQNSSGFGLTCPPTNGYKDAKMGNEVYDAKGVYGNMLINIFNEPCTNSHQSLQVTVKINEKTYRGCGQHLYYEQLNKRWILQEIDDRYLDMGDFPNGLPEIILDLVKGKMNGNDGCNTLYSDIRIQGDRIFFSTIAASKKYCQDVRSEKLKLSLIGEHLIEYRFRGNELVLYLIDDSRLIFKPAE